MDSTHENSDARGPSSLGVRLDSWKEIAAYLKRDIRTVQLWEKKEGLPIHRHTHASRASVYAYTNEIDNWQQGRKTRPEDATSPVVDEPAVPPEAAPVDAPPTPRSRYVLGAAVLVLALVAPGLFFWQRAIHHQVSPYEHSTLAILPFEDLSPGPVEAYLADGLTDELITYLGRTNRLQLISRTSVMRFKGRQESLPRIAQELHADLVLEGTVMYAGKRARITAQLIDARNDQHLWAGSYERDFNTPGDAISLQDQVAGDVANALLVKLTGGATGPAVPARQVAPDVRTAYLRGRYFWNKRDEPGLKQAVVYFNEAIAKDPGYAPAYAGLADCYNLLSVWGSLPEREAFPKAKAAAQKALQLDPDSAEAYTSLAFAAYRGEWDFAGAETFFQKAIQLNPNYATAHQWYGEFLGDLRRSAQSIAESRKAEELDPLSTIVGSDLADSYLHAERYQEAIAELQKILAMDPGFAPAHRYLAGVYARTGQEALASVEREKYVLLSGDKAAFEAERIRALFAGGNRIQARKEAESLLNNPRKGPFNYFFIAQVYLAAGDHEKALENLEKVYRQHSWWLVGLLVDPDLAPLRSDPRFQDLAGRVGLPVQ